MLTAWDKNIDHLGEIVKIYFADVPLVPNIDHLDTEHQYFILFVNWFQYFVINLIYHLERHLAYGPV